ncbi:MAG: Broad specificity phosphatase PhoE [Chloroflexi bacterium AL-W]|nr:Broad specificity phosphatase PhoE [Chloroflexi bacterium AL-N1]NOK66988.1 Broad specificity phosphatase PhoE [Chloroflexi bacterium AL-N10]NOK74720.1 Broad specificity phosphatase PhoE [Chloroflexi bacterium AL-N5]NOK81590.1 Broad specificity phosphatase PhoE [Chloroflexi bacterium AL-W]NOK89060.1 Broad specificity phosphatase PhoE [Chloroflexi bacterium AL-N15]
MKVYLIRHAQSEENTLSLRAKASISDYNTIIRGSSISPLTDRGIEQAHAVAQQLADKPIERLYCSPFLRAIDTATVIGQSIDLPPQIVDDLREVMPRTLSERHRDGPLGRHIIRAYFSMLWTGGSDESWASSYQRAKRAWSQITCQDAQEIVAVAHRGLIGLILLALRSDPHWQIIKRDLHNCGISLVVRRDPQSTNYAQRKHT